MLRPSLPDLTMHALAAASWSHAAYAQANLVYRKDFYTEHSIPLEQRAAGDGWQPAQKQPNSIGTVEDEAFDLLTSCS